MTSDVGRFAECVIREGTATFTLPLDERGPYARNRWRHRLYGAVRKRGWYCSVRLDLDNGILIVTKTRRSGEGEVRYDL